MFDIEFHQKIHELKTKIMNGELISREEVIVTLQNAISDVPVLYNIETTTLCNMTCIMCPRTNLMKRKKDMVLDMPTYEKIVEQLQPFSEVQLKRWYAFVEDNYHIKPKEMNENHFYMYIIARAVVMHGWGEPILDKHLPERIKLLADRNIPTYFSCNPANIDLNKCQQLFENGLGYLKFSIESTDDIKHKAIRGKASNFTESYKKIIKLMEMVEDNMYGTKIVLTMIDLNDESQDGFQKLYEKFKAYNPYIYLKSKNTQWLTEKSLPASINKSICWSEFCQYPWNSMSVKADGKVSLCSEDYNDESIIGDAKTQSLYEIWHSPALEHFRQNHLFSCGGIKCSERCDMKLIGKTVG